MTNSDGYPNLQDVSPSNNGYGTNPEFYTDLTSIYFYAGVQLDPKEENLYIPLPDISKYPDIVNPNNGQYNPKYAISDWWTRDQFEAECLEPYARHELDLSADNPDLQGNGLSYFTSKNNNILTPYPISRFTNTNVNFVKVVNTTHDPLIMDSSGNPLKKETIYYGFVNSVNYVNNGTTLIDWTVEEFYSNLWNNNYNTAGPTAGGKKATGLTFGNGLINKLHYQLEALSGAGKGNIIDDRVYKVPENLSSGSVQVPELSPENDSTNDLPSATNIKGTDKAKNDIFWIVIPMAVAQTENFDQKDFPSGIDMGFPDQQVFLVLPFSYGSGTLYDVTYKGKDGSTDTYTYSQVHVSKLLMDVFALGNAGIDDNEATDKSKANAALAVNTSGVSVSDYLGFDFSVDGNTVTIDGNISGADFIKRFYSTVSEDPTATPKYWFPCLYRTTKVRQLINTIANNYYQYLKQKLKTYINTVGSAGWVWDYFEEHGGFPEKLTHYVALNYLVTDNEIGSFTATEIQGDPNSNLEIHYFGSPYETIRHDLIVSPYVAAAANDNISGFNDSATLLRKWVVNLPSTITIADNNWLTYSYLNKNTMAQQQQAITTQEGITKQQNKFNLDQTQYQIGRNKGYAQQLVGQNAATTKMSAKQAASMSKFELKWATANQAGSALSSALSKNVGGAGAAGINAGVGYYKGKKGINMAYDNTMAMMGLQNQNTLANTDYQNATSGQLATNSKAFGDVIAGETAALQEANLHAGWNDVKLSPAQTLSGGSMIQYTASNGGVWPVQVASFPTISQLYTIGRIMLDQGISVELFDNPIKWFFTRELMNYVECDTCTINPSSYIENSVRTALEAMFMRGVKIWHNLDAMAANDYGPTYASTSGGNIYVNWAD